MPETTLPPKVLIFMTARNCEMYAAASLMSLARQTHDNIHVLYIDDNSEDDTGIIARRHLDELFPDRHTYIRNDVRFGKARSAWEHLRPRTHGAQFVAVLDGDDQLIDINIVTRMAKSYEAGRDVVWTNYVTDTKMVGGNAALNPNLSPRVQGWKTSHFFSFRANLLDTVPESYFKDGTGEWFLAACDIALALPMLDQTRNYEFIPVNAYCYTASNPYSHHNMDPSSQGLNSTIQRRCAQEVFGKSPLPLLKGATHENAQHSADHTSTTQNVPASQDAIWANKAADLLVVACPTILNAQAVTTNNALSPLQVWSLYQFATHQDEGRILHIGTTASAVSLAAIVASLSRVTLTCLTTSPEQTTDINARLVVSGLSRSVEIVESVYGTVTVGDVSGLFPDVSRLGSDSKYSLVVVDARDIDPNANLALVALPALANVLDPRGFKFSVLTQTRTIASAAASKWSGLSSGLKFCLDGIGGSGLVVIGGR